MTYRIMLLVELTKPGEGVFGGAVNGNAIH